MRSKVQDVKCYLCGEPATTRDHIPPRGIFPKPRPTNLITVPACLKCNGDSKLGDEYFRLMVAATSGDSPQSLNTLRQRILPRVKESPGLIIDFLRNVRPMEIFTTGGIYLCTTGAFDYDSGRIQTVIDKIVRGLFLKHIGQPLAKDCVVSNFVHNPPIDRWLGKMISSLPLNKIGDGSVFSYRYYLINLPKRESHWFLMFYNDTSLFLAETFLHAGDGGS